MIERIDDLKVEFAFDDPADGRVDVFPIYEDGHTTLIPEWSFHPTWVRLQKNVKLSREQMSRLMDEAIYRGKVLGKEFTQTYLEAMRYVG